MANSTRLVGLKKDNDTNKQLYDDLFVNDSGYRLISSSPKVFSAIHPEDFGDNFYLSEEELDYYIDGFIEAVTENVDTVTQAVISENVQNNLGDSGLDDFDVKLSLYRSFKSLYDKWISNSTVDGNTTTGYFFNNYGQTKTVDGDDKRMLFEHFSFVNRTNGDISKKAVIDFAYLSNLSNSKNGQGPTQSLYESITNVLTKNNFEFFAMPSLIGYSNSKDSELTDMFRAMDGPIDRIPAKPGFICMFIGGNSRTLDIPRSYCSNSGLNFDFVNDSFDVDDPNSYPEDFKFNGGITAFKVKYGQQTQSHFKSLELDQSEFKETQESLMVIDAISNPSSGSDPAQLGKGNNIYDMYLTRNYSCTVETLGNAQIQPMMMFKLENVPMYKGTYLITNVTHTVSVNNMKTSFKGVRQPLVTVPIITEALSLLDLALIEPVQGDAALGSNTLIGDSNNVTYGCDFDSNDIIELSSVTPEYDSTIYGDSSNQTCPTVNDIKDGGIGDAYINKKAYKIRLCKVKDTQGTSGRINVGMAVNLSNLINKAKQDGVPLTIGSNFRTMEDQISTAKGYGCYKSGSFVKSDCRVSVATPGTSSHQSGTAIDFGCNGKTICFSNDSAWCAKNGASKRPKEYPCFKWMVENANNFGFYNYKGEAWHWSANGK